MKLHERPFLEDLIKIRQIIRLLSWKLKQLRASFIPINEVGLILHSQLEMFI